MITLSTMWEDSEKVVIYKPERESPAETKPSQNLGLELFWTPEL